MVFKASGGLAETIEYVSKPSIATPLMQIYRLLTGLELPMMHAN